MSLVFLFVFVKKTLTFTAVEAISVLSGDVLSEVLTVPPEFYEFWWLALIAGSRGTDSDHC